MCRGKNGCETDRICSAGKGIWEGNCGTGNSKGPNICAEERMDVKQTGFALQEKAYGRGIAELE